jgi:glycosyltransferase involved in cell wall biosynthesis
VREVIFAIPGDIDAPTGGYVYARRLLEFLPGEGLAVRHLVLPQSFPNPTKSDLAETSRLLRATDHQSIILVDGLAFGAIPSDILDGLAHKIVALVHHPLHLETELPEARRAELFGSEKAALARAERVVATSSATAEMLAADFVVPADRIIVAEPGTDPKPRARGMGQPTELLAVGAVSPRKNYAALIAALEGLGDLNWHLTIAGALDRSPETVETLRETTAALDLAQKVTLAGKIEDHDLARLYGRADVFVSPSLFEGYGMALAEALAYGLPIVASTGGAAGQTVPDGAGLKVAPGDTAALRAALRRVVVDAPLRHALADGAWAAGQGLPRWRDTAAQVARALKAVGA